MNVERINRTIQAIRWDRTQNFHMMYPWSCIMKFALLSNPQGLREIDISNPELDTVCAVLGLDEHEHYRLFYPERETDYTSRDRERVAQIIEHFRDTGIIDWTIPKKSALDKLRRTISRKMHKIAA